MLIRLSLGDLAGLHIFRQGLFADFQALFEQFLHFFFLLVGQFGAVHGTGSDKTVFRPEGMIRFHGLDPGIGLLLRQRAAFDEVGEILFAQLQVFFLPGFPVRLLLFGHLDCGFALHSRSHAAAPHAAAHHSAAHRSRQSDG